MRLDPDKLHVEFRQGTTPTSPVMGRHYTLTHSDITAELFLTVALAYAYDKINQTRDEVFAKWVTLPSGEILLKATCSVDGENKISTWIRNEIFIKEMPLALEAMVYGDRALYAKYPRLYSSPIWIHFISRYLELDRVEYWGTPADYLN